MSRKSKLLPYVQELKRIFYIDSSIPEGLRWKVATGNRVIKDSPAGCLNSNGYYSTKINGKIYLNHRIIFSIANNTNLNYDQIIDHQDRNIQNNHSDNLRIVTATENQRNRTKRKNTSSKYIGVYFQKAAKKFHARIVVNRTQLYLGLFSSEKEAALAYNDYIINQNLSHFNLNIIEEQ